MSRTATRRAIGIVRVSNTAGRDGESFASPQEQRDRIEAACDRDGLTLLAIHEELDVSGGKPIDGRPGLSRAVAAIESGDAEVVVAAYFDRLFRSLTTQHEVLERVERAGGQVLAVDVGQVTNESAGQWLSATMLGAVSEYYRRSMRDRSHEAQQRAIRRGVVPWPNIPPGYVRGDDGRLVVDDKNSAVVRRAFAMRAAGARISDVRAHLHANSILLSYHGTQAMLTSRIYLGEIHFGDYEPNMAAHEAIIDRGVWDQVQQVIVPRGPRAKSERLLARLAVLRCATCGSRLVVGTQTQNHRLYPFYRCGRVRADCPRRVTISAVVVEEIVAAAVRASIADIEESASIESEPELLLERAQADLDAAIRNLAVVKDEPSAHQELIRLRDARDDAAALASRSKSMFTLTINGSTDWDRLSLDGQRALIKATVDRVVVSPGRGTSRVIVHLFE